MADKPSDGTPEAGSPPPRRRTRTTSAAKTSRAKPAAPRAAKRPAAATKAATAAPKAKAPARKPAATKAKAAATPKTLPAPIAAAKKFGIGKIVAIGAAAVAAGVAAILGRKKIATVSTDAIDAVMGKSETAPAEVKDLKSAD